MPRYVNDHVLKVLEKKEDQIVVKIIEGLTKEFRQSGLVNMEEWLGN